MTFRFVSSAAPAVSTLPRPRTAAVAALGAFALLFLAFGTRSALADEIAILSGENPGDGFGAVVRSIDDVDGDMRRDLVVAAPGFDGVAGEDTGKVYVISSGTFLVLRSFEGEGALDRFGSALAVRGQRVLIGAPGHDSGGFVNNGRAYVISGATGTTLATFDGAFSFDILGTGVAFVDANGDGFEDVALGSPGFDAAPGPDSGRVTILSGLDGSVLQVFDGESEDDRFGAAVAMAGLIDADIGEDVIIGAPEYDGAAGTDSGRAYLLSGLVGSTIRIFDGPGAGDLFGSSVDGGGTVDSDSVDDVVVGGPLHTQGRTERGIVRAFSGATGATILSELGDSPLSHMGTSVAIVDDIDRDGEQDVLVGGDTHDGQGGIAAGKAWLFSGATGELIFEFNGRDSGDALGTSVARLGDVDADAFSDIAIGAPLADPSAGADAGEVLVFSGDPVKHCNQGEVNLAAGEISDVLFLNGTAGGVERKLTISEGDRIWAAIIRPPAGGNGRYVVHANEQTADFNTVTVLPRAIGSSCFDFVIPFGATPVAVWNTLGKEDKVGDDMYFDGSPLPDPPPASAVFFKRTQGDPVNLPAGTVLTFQALIIDPGTGSITGASLSNAVVLVIL